MGNGDVAYSLICRVQNRLCALPIEHVGETLRPLPVEPVTGAPAYVLGLSVIRGVPLAVVDAARLLGPHVGRAERFITVMAGSRKLALAVDGVVGVRALAAESLLALPALLRDTDPGIVAAIGLLDAELLLVLRSARLLPDDLILPGAGH
jgi:purine-binding chemotaxis protein CheW